LRGDANSISRAKDRSLDYGIYTTELAGDFRQRQLVALYRSTEVWEMTRSPSDLARSVINSSVMPSLKYS